MPSRRLPRVAGMATMPSREATAPHAIASLLSHVDRLWLFLDRFESVPAFAKDDRIRVLRSQDYGDLRANGHLVGLALEDEPCTFFGVADDIHYPHDYCETLERYRRRLGRAVVGVHASVMPRTVGSYIRDGKTLHFRSHQRRALGVDFLGSGTLAVRTVDLSFDVRGWPDVNMVDLSFARVARERQVPLVMIPRAAHWLIALDENQEDAIWSAVQQDDSRQTVLAQELMALPRPRLPRSGWRRLSYRNA
jgi:hypothetical protein